MENISLSLSFRSKYRIHKFREYSDMIWCWWRWASRNSCVAKMAAMRTEWQSGRLGYQALTIWHHYRSCWYRWSWLWHSVFCQNPTGPPWKSTTHRKQRSQLSMGSATRRRRGHCLKWQIQILTRTRTQWSWRQTRTRLLIKTGPGQIRKDQEKMTSVVWK